MSRGPHCPTSCDGAGDTSCIGVFRTLHTAAEKPTETIANITVPRLDYPQIRAAERIIETFLCGFSHRQRPMFGTPRRLFILLEGRPLCSPPSKPRTGIRSYYSTALVGYFRETKYSLCNCLVLGGIFKNNALQVRITNRNAGRV